MSNNSNALQHERRIKRHQEHGWRPCKACGKSFLPPFGQGAGALRYCPDPECQELKRESIRQSKARALEKYKKRNLNSPSVRVNLRPCRSKELRGYRSTQCDGRIHNGNWLFCEICDTQFLAFNDGPAEFQVVETIDFAEMGLIPY